MEDIYSENAHGQPQPVAHEPQPVVTHDDSDDNTESLSFLRKITSLIIGILVVILIGGGVWYFVAHRSTTKVASTTATATPTPTVTFTPTPTPKKDNGGFFSFLFKKSTPTPTKTPAKIAATATPTVVETTKGGLPIATATPTQAPQQTANTSSTASWKVYTDSTFAYTVKYPSNWETYKRAGDAAAGYQIAIHPVGSSNVPVTISAQPNNVGQTLDQWIDDEYGAGYARTKGQLGSLNATEIKTPTFVSFLMMHNGNVYEISGSTVRGDYYNVFLLMLTTFKFN